MMRRVAEITFKMGLSAIVRPISEISKRVSRTSRSQKMRSKHSRKETNKRKMKSSNRMKISPASKMILAKNFTMRIFNKTISDLKTWKSMM
jgi:hypothetical protein